MIKISCHKGINVDDNSIAVCKGKNSVTIIFSNFVWLCFKDKVLCVKHKHAGSWGRDLKTPVLATYWLRDPVEKFLKTLSGTGDVAK